jgi:peptidoglycan/LPS O-acetylase OafA/YrhL
LENHRLFMASATVDKLGAATGNVVPLPALTSLRFFAAMHVFMFHLYAIQIAVFPGFLGNLQQLGYVGVSLFFVLSGFILVYVHANRDSRPGIFWRERFARIYPAYLFALILTAPNFFYVCIKLKDLDIPFYAWAKMHLPLSSTLVVTLTQSWVPPAALVWNPPAWSLSVEAFFYLLFPFMLPRILRLSDRNLVRMVSLCWLVSLGVSFAYCWFDPDQVGRATDQMNVLFWLNILKFNPLVRLPEFVLGACCGVLFLRGRLQKSWGSWLLLSGLVGFALVVFASPQIPYPILHNGLLAPVFAAMIVGLALRPAWMSWLEWKPLVLLGNASYSLYLLHSFVLTSYFLPMGKLNHPGPLGMTIGMLLPIGIAILVYRFIEEPARRKLRPKQGHLPLPQRAVSQSA